jgi:hypothetical protein
MLDKLEKAKKIIQELWTINYVLIPIITSIIIKNKWGGVTNAHVTWGP